MFALGYTIVGILLGVTFIAALAICLGIWFGIRTAKPEALEPAERPDRSS